MRITLKCKYSIFIGISVLLYNIVVRAVITILCCGHARGICDVFTAVSIRSSIASLAYCSLHQLLKRENIKQNSDCLTMKKKIGTCTKMLYLIVIVNTNNRKCYYYTFIFGIFYTHRVISIFFSFSGMYLIIHVIVYYMMCLF